MPPGHRQSRSVYLVLKKVCVQTRFNAAYGNSRELTALPQAEKKGSAQYSEESPRECSRCNLSEWQKAGSHSGGVLRRLVSALTSALTVLYFMDVKY